MFGLYVTGKARAQPMRNTSLHAGFSMLVETDSNPMLLYCFRDFCYSIVLEFHSELDVRHDRYVTGSMHIAYSEGLLKYSMLNLFCTIQVLYHSKPEASSGVIDLKKLQEHPILNV